MNVKLTLLAAAGFSALTATAGAVEGMWTPEQLPKIADDLKEKGLALDTATLTDLTAFPMGAVISLGGCTASFVSPQGLVVTNHHCAAGSIQYNSKEDNNLLEKGFLARDFAAELPAAPGSRIYVTVAFEDVTKEVLKGVERLQGRARYDAIDKKRKALIAACEQDAGHRCDVASFHGGLEYKRIKRLEIRDVRLVYAPPESIGTYGGDIDNWMWPRHTGDFSFYRAYVGPDGKPADFAAENKPFVPAHTLKVSAAGLDEGDFVMAAGYPGSTDRYRRRVEVEQAFGWEYPEFETMLGDWIATIEAASPEGSDARIKYESRLQSLNNYMKNLSGQIEGARRVNLAERRRAREAALDTWIKADAKRAPYARAIAELDAVLTESLARERAEFGYDNATRPQLLQAALRLYRLANEQKKPDAERDAGFQARDERFIRQGLEAIQRRFDPIVEKAEWKLFLKRYMDGPAGERVAAFDNALGLPESYDEAAISKILDDIYARTDLDVTETRLSWIGADLTAFDTSEDPMIKLAMALYPHEKARIDQSKALAGKLQALRPKYMEAIIAWQASQGEPVYPDANSTLRVTYGAVFGGSPKDGLVYAPFTTLEGIVDKHTGETPFDAPDRLLQHVQRKDYGRYASQSLGSVPVNFLSDLDSTGGNSGSPTMNAKGELVGLLFDGTLESVNSDWDFDVRTTRTIHVDSRYMLWVMEKVDGADRLLKEMTIVGE
jgi:hypothetical protein